MILDSNKVFSAQLDEEIFYFILDNGCLWVFDWAKGSKPPEESCKGNLTSRVIL